MPTKLNTRDAKTMKRLVELADGVVEAAGRAAVSRVLVLLVALGRKPCAKNSGAYCRSRAKLPEPVIRRLTREVAEGCERAVPGHWLSPAKKRGNRRSFANCLPTSIRKPSC